MKETLYKWTLLCLMFTSTISLFAQEKIECKRDFVIKTNITPSTCTANGMVEVILEGDLSELELELTEYAIRPIDGTEGTNLPFSKSNILRYITAGTYVISVRTFCIDDTSIGVVRESSNVVVGGDYKPLMAEFDLSRMRKSYANCATGLIPFNIKSGTGYGDLSFHISKAPAGVSTGLVTPTKGATTGGYVQYALPDLYPSGEYQIDIYDSCSKGTIVFTLEETSGLPNPSYSSSSFYPVAASCSKVSWRPGSPTDSEVNHHRKHFLAGLYEITLLPKDQVPVESDWITWTTSYPEITLPSDYKNYFGTGSLVAHVRLKPCNEINNSISTGLKTPYLSNGGPTYYCDFFKRSIRSWNDYDSFWCYPIEVAIIDNDTQAILASETHETLGARSLLPDYEYTYGQSYSFRLTDASGHIYTINHGITRFNPSISMSVANRNCTTFTGSLSSSSSYSCYPIEVKVYKKDDTGSFNLLEEIQMTSYSKSIEYPYGEYKLDATYNYIDPTTGEKFTSSYTNSVLSTNPTSLTLTSVIYTPTSYANENYGALRIYGNAAFPVGTRLTVTDAPEGYIHKGKTFVSSSSSTYLYLGTSMNTSNYSAIYMPTGNYTITVEDDCGTNLTTTTWLEVGYDAKDVKYTLEENGCDGGIIKLNTQEGGYVKYTGIPNASYTNFIVISGPSGGYETSLKSHNQSLKIVADGEYIIGTVISSSYTYSHIRRDTIHFEKSKPILNPTVTSSYVCTEPTALYGYLIFTGKGGKAPYAYELLEEDETPTGLTAVGNEGERVVFNYGVAGETYIVRITDACGNATTQQMTLADLRTQKIVYSIPPEGNYCTGDELKLNCITLGQTDYLWEKKVSEGVYEFVSNQQNPRISPVTTAHSGVYRVTVTPEYCGEAITGEITIKVFPPLEIGATSGDQDICVATRTSAMSYAVSGGKGNYNYQWQTSTDQTIWTDIALATNSTYAPIHTKSGIYYYRLMITDDCNTVTGETITLNVKPCYIMVNPNIRTKAI